MSVSTNYSRLNNQLDSQETPKINKKFKNIKDWSLGMQCNGNTYDGVSVPARESAITVVVLAEGTFFSFNVTYVKQVQKVCELFSETVKKYTENSDSIKLWKILPYKKLFAEPLGLIDVWIANTFPNASVENKNLGKGCCFSIERKNGNGVQEYKPESLYKKAARSASKCYSILSCKEDKFTVS